MAADAALAPTTHALVRTFGELSRADVGFAGGKVANLGELTRAGPPVPSGYVVGAPAYALVCDHAGLRHRIDGALEGVDVDDPSALQQAAEKARELVEAEALPEEVEAEIRAAYARLGDDGVAVAVRSSATAEDTEQASFAGMNETFLNISGADDVVAAVRRCWASLFGARTVFYRAKRGFGQSDMDIAVVVQRQVRSAKAGVMFTIDPATGAIDRLVIEGSFGLGEAVVAGQVSPDRYVVDKATLAVRAREVRRKDIAVWTASGGGAETRPLTADEAGQPVLTDDEAGRLAELGGRIERHYGQPQDTEWAIDDDGAVWILQARPVTAIGHLADPEPTAGRVLARGLGAAPGIASGPVRILGSLADDDRLAAGDMLVTHMTAPDWVPLMRRASAIVTDSGGMMPRRHRLPRTRNPVSGRNGRCNPHVARLRGCHRRCHPRRRA